VKTTLALRSAGALLTAAALVGVGGSPATAATDSKAAASEALGRGDGAAAAQAIRDADASADPEALAEIIYDGGVIAVDSGKGDAFSDAVPVAFVDGGVSFVNANQAFRVAFGIVMANGVTPEQGRVGGLAIIKTEAAYVSTGKIT
jgi:hypothetical protein